MNKQHIAIFTWQELPKEELEVVTNLVTAAWPDASFEFIYLVNALTRLDSLKHLTADKYLAFGKRAANYVSTYFPTLIELPKSTDLLDKEGNEVIRESTWNLIQTLKNKSFEDLELELNKNDLQSFFRDKLKLLTTSGEELKFVGKTALGKTVLVTTNKQNLSDGFDYSLTFEELYAARFACELFKIDTLTISKGKKNDKG